MTNNDKIDRVFAKGGNVTLIVGHRADQKRLLVNARRIIEVSPILGRVVSHPTNHDPNHHRIMVRKPDKYHTQLFLLADNPDAWLYLCAIFYPKSESPVPEIEGAVKLDIALHAVAYEMRAPVSREWPRLKSLTRWSWKEMWVSMNAVFLLEMRDEFNVISREIIYGYPGSFQDLVPESHDPVWGEKVVVAMDDVRDSIRRAVIHIIGVASEICPETERTRFCDDPSRPCAHQRDLAREVWGNEANRTFYNGLASKTPNQIRVFWVGVDRLRQWLSNVSSPYTPDFVDIKRARREAEIFSRKWNSLKGPLGICLYCDADGPTFPITTRRCRREYCRAEYAIWIAQGMDERGGVGVGRADRERLRGESGAFGKGAF